MSTPIQELSWPVAILVLKKSDQNSVSNILWKSQWLRQFLRTILLKVQLTSLDVRFGSLWTSITREEFNHLSPKFGERFEVTIYNNDMLVYQNQVTYGKSFRRCANGQPILYINSLYRVGLAINQGSFAKAYNVGVGASWHIEIKNGKLTGDIRMKQKSLFSIKDVVAIGVGAALFVVIAMLQIPCTCTEYEHSVAICPSSSL